MERDKAFAPLLALAVVILGACSGGTSRQSAAESSSPQASAATLRAEAFGVYTWQSHDAAMVFVKLRIENQGSPTTIARWLITTNIDGKTVTGSPIATPNLRIPCGPRQTTMVFNQSVNAVLPRFLPAASTTYYYIVAEFPNTNVRDIRPAKLSVTFRDIVANQTYQASTATDPTLANCTVAPALGAPIK